MYGVLTAALVALIITCELLFHAYKVQRSVTYRAAYPMLALTLVGSGAHALGQPFALSFNMYVLTLICAFLAPLAFAALAAPAKKKRK